MLIRPVVRPGDPIKGMLQPYARVLIRNEKDLAIHTAPVTQVILLDAVEDDLLLLSQQGLGRSRGHEKYLLSQQWMSAV